MAKKKNGKRRAVVVSGVRTPVVKAVGQVELILSILASTLFFHEKITARELAGIAVLCLSIVLLVVVI